MSCDGACELLFNETAYDFNAARDEDLSGNELPRADPGLTAETILNTNCGYDSYGLRFFRSYFNGQCEGQTLVSQTFDLIEGEKYFIEGRMVDIDSDSQYDHFSIGVEMTNG